MSTLSISPSHVACCLRTCFLHKLLQQLPQEGKWKRKCLIRSPEICLKHFCPTLHGITSLCPHLPPLLPPSLPSFSSSSFFLFFLLLLLLLLPLLLSLSPSPPTHQGDLSQNSWLPGLESKTHSWQEVIRLGFYNSLPQKRHVLPQTPFSEGPPLSPPSPGSATGSTIALSMTNNIAITVVSRSLDWTV